MININKNGEIAIQRKLTLSQRQLRTINSLRDRDKQKYLMNLLGLSNERNAVIADARMVAKSIRDEILNRKPSAMLKTFEQLLRNGEGVNHAPPAKRLKDSNWVGVEIEFLIDGRDDYDCSTCDNTGRIDCSTCDGSGQVYDSEDNEVECPDCDGSGHFDCDECDGQRGGVREALRTKIRNAKLTGVTVKSDGSLGDDDNSNAVGVEITMLFDTKHGFSKLTKLCQIINSMGGRVNSTCGLHVHVDRQGMKKSEVREIGSRLGYFLPILSKLVPKTRRTNSYCALRVSNGDRYSAINLESFDAHKTIEFRLHSGTTNPVKITNWIRLMQWLTNYATHNVITEKVETLDALAKLTNLPQDLVTFYESRILKFNTENQNAAHTDDEASGQTLEAQATASTPRLTSQQRRSLEQLRAMDQSRSVHWFLAFDNGQATLTSGALVNIPVQLNAARITARTDRTIQYTTTPSEIIALIESYFGLTPSEPAMRYTIVSTNRVADTYDLMVDGVLTPVRRSAINESNFVFDNSGNLYALHLTQQQLNAARVTAAVA